VAVVAETTTRAGLGRRLLAPTIAIGTSYGNFAISLPLLVLATDGDAALVGKLVALDTVAFSVGALLTGTLPVQRARIPGALIVVALGSTLFSVAPSTVVLALGAVCHGIGMGMFWVSVQLTLGRSSGVSGSERAFVGQYATYVCGTALGALVTGATIAGTRLLGASDTLSIRLSFLVALTGCVLAWSLIRVLGDPAAAPDPQPRAAIDLLHGLALQSPNLLLVSGIAVLLSFTPVILSDTFGYSPLAIGLVSAGVAGAKIAGSFAAGRAVATVNRRVVVGAMLAASALASAGLAATQSSSRYVALVLAATFFGIGVWPVVVDGAQARVSPDQRGTLSIAWNVREYMVIAVATFAGGLVLDSSDSPSELLALVAALLVASAVAALAVLGRPVYAPGTA
jgi:predicted MFS family arabinose efflux permease